MKWHKESNKKLHNKSNKKRKNNKKFVQNLEINTKNGINIELKMRQKRIKWQK